jgi:hypothetical protein
LSNGGIIVDQSAFDSVFSPRSNVKEEGPGESPLGPSVSALPGKMRLIRAIIELPPDRNDIRYLDRKPVQLGREVHSRPVQ